MSQTWKNIVKIRCIGALNLNTVISSHNAASSVYQVDYSQPQSHGGRPILPSPSQYGQPSSPTAVDPSRTETDRELKGLAEHSPIEASQGRTETDCLDWHSSLVP